MIRILVTFALFKNSTMLKSQKEFCCNLISYNVLHVLKKKVCRIPQEFESSCDKNNSDQKCRKLFSYRLDMSQKQQVGNNLSIDIVLMYISTQLMYMYIIQVWWNLESSSVESVTLHASYILSPVQCTMMHFYKI